MVRREPGAAELNQPVAEPGRVASSADAGPRLEHEGRVAGVGQITRCAKARQAGAHDDRSANAHDFTSGLATQRTYRRIAREDSFLPASGWMWTERLPLIP